MFLFSVEIFTKSQAESPGRLNEDAWVFVEDEGFGVAAVLDGATALGAVSGVVNPDEPQGRFASQLAAVGIESAFRRGETESAKDLLLSGNRRIADILCSCRVYPDYSLPERLPNTQAVVVLVKKNAGIAQVAQIGDSPCLVKWNNSTVELALPLEITPQDTLALQQALHIARETGITFKEALATPPVMELMIEGRRLCNRRDGTGVGVLNGQSSASRYIKTRQFQLSEVKELVLLSDGLFFPSKEIGALPDWKKLVDIIDEKGASGLYKEVTAQKQRDPGLDEFPRFKPHDDATAVVVQISPA